MGITNVCCFRPSLPDSHFENERVRPKVEQVLISQAHTALDSYDATSRSFDRTSVGHAYSALGHRLRLGEPMPGEPASSESISAPLHPDDRSEMLALHKHLEDILMKRTASAVRQVPLQRAVSYPRHLLPPTFDPSQLTMQWAQSLDHNRSHDAPASQSELRPLRREMSLPSRERLDVALQLHLARAQAAAATFTAAENRAELPVSHTAQTRAVRAEDAQLQSAIDHYRSFNRPN